MASGSAPRRPVPPRGGYPVALDAGAGYGQMGWPIGLRERSFFRTRCLAEKYETVEAIAVFRRATTPAPDSLDAHMGLLAELSVMVSRPVDDLPGGAAEEWERQFLAQRELVSRRFGDVPIVRQVLAMMQDESAAGDMSKLSPAEVARRRRTTSGTIRWKQR